MVRSRWTLLLAVLLLSQWAAAYGHCRVLAAEGLDGFAGSICSLDGHHGVGGDQDTGKRKGFADQDCPACHQLPVLQAGVPPTGSVQLRWFVMERASAAILPVRPPPRAPPYRAHAPPTA